MDNNPFFEERKQEKSQNIFIDILQSVAIAGIISIFLYFFILTPNEVDGNSMVPNFETGDLLFTSKLHKWFDGTSFGHSTDFEYDRGDVVVFQKPGFEDFVKRVIGLPGETVTIENGVYYINGQRLSESYDLNNSLRKGGALLTDGGPGITLASDEYFVSGDNRDVSFDSRDLGGIKREWLKGKVMFRFWPLDKFGIIKGGKQELN
jgi:signal peptidase I